MGSNWKTVKLNEITSKITKGTTPSKKDGGFSDTGINYIKAEAVSYEGRIDSSSFVFITPEIHDKLKRSKLEKDDILFSMAGAYLGKTGIVKAEYLPANTNQALALIRPIKDLVVPNYLHLYLRQKSVVHFVNNATSQSAQPNINLQDIGNLKIRLPDLDTQKSIAKVLGDLDDKIELNNQTNQTLEQMAQALFKSWFVDFDPVFDNLLASVDFKLENLETSLPDELKQKAQRRLMALDSLENAAECKASLIALAHELQAELPTKEATQAAEQVSEKAAETPVKANLNANPKILTQHANTHAHFPNEFEHNEQLGWIPKGWEVSALSELINIKHGFAYKGEFFSEEKTEDVLLTPGNVKEGGGFKGDKYKYYKGPIIEEYRFNKNDMYVNMTDLSKASDTLGYPAVVPEMDGVTFHHNQRLGKVLYTDHKSAKTGFIYQILCSNNSRNNILASATGTTVKHTSPTKILSLMICHSGGSIESLYEKNAKIFSEKLAGNNSNNIELTKLRDTLLPKLISGELQIPDVATDDETVD